MFDIFYFDKLPKSVPFARQVVSLNEAYKLSRTRYFWIVDYLCDYSEWDFLWEPAPWESEYRHAFASQHQADCGTYLVPKTGYKETKYNSCIIPRVPTQENWTNTDYTDFDYSWHPSPTDPPYIYYFPTQHQRTGGPVYTVPDATDIKYVSTMQVVKETVDDHWNDLSYDFDYTWHPDLTDEPYIYQFGTQHQKTGGPRYVMPGATEVKYVRTIKCKRTSVDQYWETPDGVQNFDYTWHPDATDKPYVYQFGTQWQKTGGPRYVMPGATEMKYVQNPRCEKTSIDSCWHIPEDAEYEDFDQTWHPDATDKPYVYQFGTQWQKTGGPRYVVPGATETKYVDQIKIKTERFAKGAIVIDHFDGNTDKVQSEISDRTTVLKTARYFDNYLDTIKRVISTLEDQEYVWIVSSVCDYTDFDFSWHPETWQAAMLHVFASNEQKFGDTFFVHVPSFLSRIDDVELLDWYDCNFVEDITVPRRPMQVISHNEDTHMDVIQDQNFRDPLVLLSNSDVDIEYIPTVSLWREKTKTVVPLTPGATNVILPRVSLPYIKTQIYDYPNIDKTKKHIADDHPMDVIFISNGETNAEQNWKHLSCIAEHIPNRVVRVDGVQGRAQAYRAALQASKTEWAFCIFAKLEANPEFDWNWQPDRLQQAKHYIFHAKNPVNNLTYGHMAMIAYNKKLVEINPATGLDFTLDQKHEVVPMLSGIARYAHDPWIAWRSAFRECIKLKHSLPNIENEYRLEQWLTVNAQNDELGDWSIRGANDAVEYYNRAQGSFDLLRLTYEWDWLAEYFTERYNQSPAQKCTQFLSQ